MTCWLDTRAIHLAPQQWNQERPKGPKLMASLCCIPTHGAALEGDKLPPCREHFHVTGPAASMELSG
jgi:hypothetical protein